MIKTVNNAYDALELIKKESFDILVTDLRMPGLSGIDLIEKAIKIQKDLQSIVITGHGDLTQAIAAIKLGASGYLKKPFSIEDLHLSIIRACEKKYLMLKLKESENRFRKTFIHAASGIALIHQDGSFEEVNSSFCNLLDYSKDELLKMSLNDIIFKDDQHIDFFQAHKLKEDELDVSIREKRYFKKDQTLRWMDEYISSLQNDETDKNLLIVQILDITDRKKAEEKVEYIAGHCVLTGLSNRYSFMEHCKRAINRALRSNNIIALLLIDLDHFKNVNDTFGHDTGDKLLVEAAKCLLSCVRETDTISRVGGDEFYAILENIESINDIAVIAKRINDCLTLPFIIDDHEIRIGSSIGISIFPNDDNNTESLLRKADIAMYQVKTTGRNAFKFFTPEMDHEIQKKAKLTNQIHTALEKEQFVLNYMPIIDIRTNRITGIEALLRWQHPEMGMLLPETFIPLLEETGLIVPVGEWVLKEALTQSQTWQKKGIPSVNMAVNFSVRQFHDKHMIKKIEKIITETHQSPGCVQIEISEGFFLKDDQHINNTLNELRELGIGMIVMDKFGMGLSSLSFLKRFRIDGIKIDRFFIKGIMTNSYDAALVSAIAGMGLGLNLKSIVAVGVEHEDQIPFLRQIGCSCYQGAIYGGMPVPTNEMEKILIKNFQIVSGEIDNQKVVSENLKILVVDDSTFSRQIVVMNLERNNYCVESAENGQEAIHLFKHNTYDLILMDIMMPAINGFETAHNIRKLECQTKKDKKIPIIAMTAYYNENETVLKAGWEDFDDYILKPIKKKILINKVTKWI
ncbi:MAG: EAL domain-containing protein [Desulfobacterales bacterium]|nr:EAL domain-containing protein [Desulfobacterales bacterium]